MRHAAILLKRLLVEEDGPTAVEYAVMLAGVLIAALVGGMLLGSAVARIWADNKAAVVGI